MMDEVQQQWKNIFDKDILRGSVNIIALYITVYELLEDTIISKPKDFYTVVEFDDRAQQQYEQEVLALYRKEACPGLDTKNKALIASLLWFKSSGAIDEHDIQIFTESRKLRNKITHEMYGAIVEGGSAIAEQFALLYCLFCKIECWWVFEIEAPITDDIPADAEIDLNGVMSGNMVVLNVIMDILMNDSNSNFKAVCESLGVEVK
jgi:hypothetical protein